MALLGATAVLGCHREPVKAAGSEVPEVVTLIQDAEGRCARIARQGLERFQSAEEKQQRDREAATAAEKAVAQAESPETPAAAPAPDPQSVQQKYLDEEAAPELAAVERAGELVRGMLPKVKEEVEPEVAEAIDKLFRSQEQVCERARTARPKRKSFQENLDYAVHGYEEARAKLEALYPLSDADVQFARHKLDPLLEAARANAANQGRPSPEQLAREQRDYAADQEFQARQQAEHEAAVSRWRQREEAGKGAAQQDVARVQGQQPEQMQQAMRSWYAAYAGKAKPVKTALGNYLSVRQATSEEVRDACQELLGATSSLLADRAALAAPDLVVRQTLQRAYGQLQECARSCAGGQTAEASFLLGSFEGSLREAAAALRPYAVNP